MLSENSRTKATNRYDLKHDVFRVRMSKEDATKFKEKAEQCGMPIQSYAIKLLKDKLGGQDAESKEVQ